jgi:hypothetical protein
MENRANWFESLNPVTFSNFFAFEFEFKKSRTTVEPNVLGDARSSQCSFCSLSIVIVWNFGYEIGVDPVSPSFLTYLFL